MKRISLRAYARHRGEALSAVQRAIASGRLTAESVGHTAKGRPFILDIPAADAEWDAHTRPRIDSRKAAPARSASQLADATLRERNARAETAELENARKKQTLVPAAGVERLVTEIIVQARTSLLGLPTRARQRLPHLTVADMATLDALVREILEEMADAASHSDRRAG